MGVFSDGDGRRGDGVPDEPAVADFQEPGHQGTAFALVDAFAEYDATGLATLDPAGRAEQLRARQQLYDYVDRIWQDAKVRGLDPANRPEWSVVAGLRDLADALRAQALQARVNANDDT